MTSAGPPINPIESERYVSTGRLPPADVVAPLVTAAHRQYAANAAGKNSSVYAALARTPSNLFGICVVGTNGNVHAAGDSDHEFSIMSVSKPFVFALVCEALGADEVRAEGRRQRHRAGRSIRSGPSNVGNDGRTNPMVNSGAIATTSLVPGATLADKWEFIRDGLSRFAGRRCRSTKRFTPPRRKRTIRNQGIARLLQSYGRVYMDPAEATDLYTKQCSLNVSAKDLAVMGATLADGGVNPLTKERVVDPPVCHYALAVMATAGPVRDVRRLALRHRPAGQERDRRRDRHRLAGQGRAGDVRPAARRGRQQRQGATRGQVPVPAIGHGPVRLGRRRLGVKCTRPGSAVASDSRKTPMSRPSDAPKSAMQKLLDVVERVGNKVPHPAVLFFLLIGLVVVLSHRLAPARDRASPTSG